MKRGALLAALFGILFIHCETETKPAQPDASAEIAQLRAQLEAEKKKNALEQQYIEEATKTINTVHDQLMTLQPIETTLRDVQKNKAEGVAMTPTQREDMLATIDAVEKSLQNDTKMLEEFRARTQNAEGKVAGLEETIAKLQAIAEAKNKEIVELRESLREMSEKVTTLQQTHESDQSELQKRSDELAATTEQLHRLTAQLYEVRYLRGSVADLVTQGVLLESRHFFRKSVALAPNLRVEQFDTADSRGLHELPVAGRSGAITIYPVRPPSSFHIAGDGPNAATLVIDDPNVFWQTRFLVVAVDR